MQTTLLAIAIAIIMAVAAALAGPFFVDWNEYRAVFEREASRVAGAPVTIRGAIDARILPTPSVTLREIAIAGANGETRIEARELGMELSLGALARGEWRADDLRLAGGQLQLGLDPQGRIDWSGSLPAVSIDRLAIADTRVVLTDAASGTRIVLEQLWFNGEFRSLAGPIKGEGAFVTNDERYGYRLGLSRSADANTWRLRLALDGSNRPIAFETDGALRFEGNAPRFEGAFSLAQLSGVALANGRAVASEPWRAAGRVKASVESAQFEQLELSYSAEDRLTKLGGSAEWNFGANPQMKAALSARQLDVGRLIALPEASRRTPAMALKALNDQFAGVLRPTMPLALSLSVDALTLAGGNLLAFRGDARSAPDGGWSIDALEFRAPGFAQIRAGGQLTRTPEGIGFSGPVSIEATEPKAFAAWLEGRTAPTGTAIGALRASGDLTFGAGRIGIERLKAELDRKEIAGRLVYASGATDGPRLEAVLKAADLDIDGAVALAQAALPDLKFDMPRHIALTLDAGRAQFAGVEARDAKVKLTIDPRGLNLEQLAIADLGGARVDAKASVQEPWTAPRGSATLDLEGNSLDGVTAVLDRFAPPWAESFRAAAPRLVPAKLRATLTLTRPQAASNEQVAAVMRIDGKAAALRIAASADAAGDPAVPSQGDLRAEVKLDADDGAEIIKLTAAEGVFSLAKGPAGLRVTATGKGQDLRVEGRLTAGGFEGAVRGNLRAFAEDGIAGSADVNLAAADAVILQQALGRTGQSTPLTLRARLNVTPRQIALTNVIGLIAGSNVNGRFAFPMQLPLKVDGRIETEAIDVAALLRTLSGAPAATSGSGVKNTPGWSAEPFDRGLLGRFGGQIAVQAAKASIMPNLEAQQLRALLRFSDTGMTAEEIRGSLAGGRLEGQIALHHGLDGLSADMRLKLTAADLATMLPAQPRAPVTGRVNVQFEAKGSGRSMASLLGALDGSGILSAEGVALARLDPRAFESVIRATDGVLAIEAAKIKDIVEPALDAGRLGIPTVEAPLSIGGGQVRMPAIRVKGERADVGASGSVDLLQSTLDARLTLLGPEAEGVLGSGRPEIFVGLKGPLASPTRSLDLSALVGWLTLRSVDIHAKRLESAEAERRAAATAPAPQVNPLVRPGPATAPSATAPANPPSAGEEAPPASTTLPSARRPTTNDPSLPQPSGAARVTPDSVAPSPSPRRPAVTSSSQEAAPALPPPIDIKPAPAPAPAQRRPAARQPGDADLRPAPPSPNSSIPAFIERLFGSQR